MKQIIIVFLILIFAGCAKQHITQPVKTDGTKVTTTKEITKEKAGEAEVVREKIAPEKRPETVALPAAKEEARFEIKDVLFDYDQYAIRADARPVLDAASDYLKRNGGTNVAIEGHCDERGTNEYNLALGERRAKSVRDYLASLGVAPARMTFTTYGEEKPLCTEQNESCYQKNRRAHFVMAK